MIKVIKGFYKRSDNKTYKIGQEVSFSDADNKRLIKEGLAVEVKKVKAKVKK